MEIDFDKAYGEELARVMRQLDHMTDQRDMYFDLVKKIGDDFFKLRQEHEVMREDTKNLADFYSGLCHKYEKRLKHLQDAIMAMKPFGPEFGFGHSECHSCGRPHEVHDNDCPVMQLRVILKEQGIGK